MPAISKFLGIVIMMYYDEYNPPHFHAKYQEQEGIFSLEGEIIDSDLPLKQRRLVSEWARLHRCELYQNWDRMRNSYPPENIDPL